MLDPDGCFDELLDVWKKNDVSSDDQSVQRGLLCMKGEKARIGYGQQEESECGFLAKKEDGVWGIAADAQREGRL